MSADDIFNALCAVWIQEDKRLSDKVKELEALIRYRTDNDALLLELIRARARREYFLAYIVEVLDYVKHFR